jgi:hypothetical protein
VRILESGAERLVFVFNHSEKAAEVEVKLPGAWSAADLETGAAVPSLAKQLAARDVWVLRLSPHRR